MAETKAPRIGLVTDSDFNRHVLKAVLSSAGYELSMSLDAIALAGYFSTVVQKYQI